jgi:hypothetical protein
MVYQRLTSLSRFTNDNKNCCSMSAAAKRWRYLRRLVLFRQMDFEFAFWQMIYLMTAPHEVKLFFLLNSYNFLKPGHTRNPYRRERLSIVDLLIRRACFFNRKSILFNFFFTTIFSWPLKWIRIYVFGGSERFKERKEVRRQGGRKRKKKQSAILVQCDTRIKLNALWIP